jgi:hypothetical protein
VRLDVECDGREQIVNQQASLGGADDFTRLHGIFVEHFAHAVIFSWSAAAFAAWHAPWLQNIRGLLGPATRAESTGSYLFALPILMTMALATVAFGGDTIRRAQLFRNQYLEFGFAGIVVFAVFCASVARAAAVMQLGF